MKLLFDECVGKPHVDGIARLAQMDLSDERPEVRHILEFQQQGVWDEQWIPRVASEGWILITADRGKKGPKKGEKLPRLCVRHRITHVVLSTGMHRRKSFEKMLAILSVWYVLLKLRDAPPGSRYQLEPTFRGQAKLVHKQLPPDSPLPVPPKGRLFDPETE